MFKSIQETQLNVEIAKQTNKKTEQYIALIYDDFILEETIDKDLIDYNVKGLFYDENTMEKDVNEVKDAACFLVDGAVYDKNKNVIMLIKKLSPETNIILITSNRLKDQSLKNTEYVYTVIQEYERNKLTLLLAIRNAVSSFLSNSLFDKHIRAFENYAFYLRENDLLNTNSIIKNLNNYFNLISDFENDFRYVAIENNDNKPFLIGGTDTLVKELKRKDSKEATILKTLFKKTIEEQQSLNCDNYSTFFFSDLYGNSIVFILENLRSLNQTNKRLCELLISTTTNFLFIAINERKRVDFYLHRLMKLSKKINPLASERDLHIFNNLFQDIQISDLSQSRILFFYLSNVSNVSNISDVSEKSFIYKKNSVKIGEKILLNKEEQDIYHLFLLVKEKRISKEGFSEAEKNVPHHLLKPILEKYSQYNYM